MANASGHVKRAHLWTIKQVSALFWNELREAAHSKENKQIKIIHRAFKRFITSPGKTAKKKKSIVDEFLFVSCTNQQMIQTHLGKLSYFCSPNILRFGLLGRWAFSFFFSPKLLKFPLAGLGTKHVPKSKTHPRIQTLS